MVFGFKEKCSKTSKIGRKSAEKSNMVDIFVYWFRQLDIWPKRDNEIDSRQNTSYMKDSLIELIK